MGQYSNHEDAALMEQENKEKMSDTMEQEKKQKTAAHMAALMEQEN